MNGSKVLEDSELCSKFIYETNVMKNGKVKFQSAAFVAIIDKSPYEGEYKFTSELMHESSEPFTGQSNVVLTVTVYLNCDEVLISAPSGQMTF